jgi:hypothetical protein
MRLHLIFIISAWFVCLGFASAASESSDPATTEQPSDLEADLIKAGEMNTEGLPSSVRSVLDQYYVASMGGEGNWKQVQSLRFKGELETAEGIIFDFSAFMKKPNLCKAVISSKSVRFRYTLAFNGEDAWQSTFDPSTGEQVSDMPEAEASNFKRDAWFGGQLLYPTLKGKEIEQGETYRKDGVPLVDLKVTTRLGAEITYTIALDGFIEVARSHFNQVNGEIEVSEYSDFREVDGLSIPFLTVLSIDGVDIQTIRTTTVEVNCGVASWIFDRP